MCLLWNRNDWSPYFPPSGFLLGLSHWPRRGWRHQLSDNQRNPTKLCDQSVGPGVYYQGLIILLICLLLPLLLLSEISPNIWDFYRLFDLQATNLAPQDLNGKSDPYLFVRIGQQTMDTKDRYIPKQLNPTFGESVLYPSPRHLSPALWLGKCLTPSMLCTFFQGVWIHSVLPPGNRITGQSFGPWSCGVWWCDRRNAAWPRESLLQPPQSHLWSGSLLRHVNATLAILLVSIL